MSILSAREQTPRLIKLSLHLRALVVKDRKLRLKAFVLRGLDDDGLRKHGQLNNLQHFLLHAGKENKKNNTWKEIEPI